MKLLLLDLVAWLACAFARISTASDSRTVPALKLPWGVYEAVQMEEDPNVTSLPKPASTACAGIES